MVDFFVYQWHNVKAIFLLAFYDQTNGSMDAAVSLTKETGCQEIVAICLVAAPEGIKLMYEKHPDVKIITAAVDRCLDERGYILPGLGDAGDRLFGTK